MTIRTIVIMHITFDDEAIERLRRIMADAYGEPFTAEEARVIANDLLAFYNVLARIVDQMPEKCRAHLERVHIKPDHIRRR